MSLPAAPVAPALTVGELMSRRVTTVGLDATAAEIAALMRERRIRHLPVVDADGRLVGLVTHRDLLSRAAAAEGGAGAAGAQRLMSTPVATIHPGADVRRAAETMLERKFGCLPVVSGGRLVGILTESDFVRRLSRSER